MTSPSKEAPSILTQSWEYVWGQKTNGVVKYWIVGPTEDDDQQSINTVVTINNDRDDAEDIARLISSAPEMLAALKTVRVGLGILSRREPDHKGIVQHMAIVDAAIAKAEGGAS